MHISYTLHTHEHTVLWLSGCGFMYQNHQLTPCQLYTRLARWVGGLTPEARHSVTGHVFILIIRSTRLTYCMTLPLFLQRREIVVQPVKVGGATHYHKDTLHTRHIKPSPSNQLSLVMSTSSKRHWQEGIRQNTCYIKPLIMIHHNSLWQWLTSNLIHSGSLCHIFCKRSNNMSLNRRQLEDRLCL